MKYTLENLFGIKDEVIVVSGGTAPSGWSCAEDL